MTLRQPVKLWPGVERGFELVEVHRPIQSTVNVVFARPLQLDRRAVGTMGLGDGDRFDDVVRPRIGAAAETAARVQRVDAHLLRIEPGGFGCIALIHRLELIAGPDLAAARRQLDDGVERLHGGVRQIGKFIACRHRASGSAERPGRIALFARLRPGLLGELSVLGHDGPGTAGLGVGIVPFHGQGVAPLLGRPEIFGDHRHTARHLNHLDNSRDGAGRIGIESLDGTAEPRRPPDQRHQHAGHGHIERELRRAIALGRDIDPRGVATADEPEVRRVLQRHLFRYRQRWPRARPANHRSPGSCRPDDRRRCPWP